MSRVELPQHVTAPFDVFVNGVPQREGSDYSVEGRTLIFTRSLAREGELGFWRWLSMVLGVAGTYRQNDTVDLVYQVGARRQVASGLPLLREESETRSPR